MSLSERMTFQYLSRPKVVRLCLDFPFVQLTISCVDVPVFLRNGAGDAGQPSHPVTLYLTITVSADLPPPIIPNNAPEIPTKGDEIPPAEAIKPSMAPDSGGPTASEPLLPSSDPLSVETCTPMPDGQAELSPTEKALIALRRADEAKRPIDRANTWEGAISRIKWVMDTVSPIAEVRAISILPLLD